MLNCTIKSAAKAAEETARSYVGIGKVYTQSEIANAKALLAKTQFVDDQASMADGIASYKAAHQPLGFINETNVKPNKIEHIDFFA